MKMKIIVFLSFSLSDFSLDIKFEEHLNCERWAEIKCTNYHLKVFSLSCLSVYSSVRFYVLTVCEFIFNSLFFAITHTHSLPHTHIPTHTYTHLQSSKYFVIHLILSLCLRVLHQSFYKILNSPFINLPIITFYLFISLPFVDRQKHSVFR